jgi:phosphorylase kinase alpha/beta subunit
LVLDVLIGHAVRLSWLDHHPEHQDCYADYKASAWNAFYAQSPHQCAMFVAQALRFLMQLGQVSEQLEPETTHIPDKVKLG